MTAKMPIAAMLMSGVKLAYMGEILHALNLNPTAGGTIHGRECEPHVRAKVMQCLQNSVPFDVQVASELYWGNPKEYYRLDRDFGPMRLPYDAVWLEWGIPRTGYRNGKKYDEYDMSRSRFAAYVYVEDPQEHMPPRSQQAVMAQMLAWSPEWNTPDPQPPVLLNEVALQWGIDYQGLYVNNSLSEWKPEGMPRDITALMMQEAKSNVFVACMALNLVNCRNVTIAKAGVVPVRRTTTEKRRGVEPVRFHTIVLPGMTVVRGKPSRKQEMANADALRHHMVRGHFKTFTKDKPLLGKHVGTYWWSPNVRGSDKKGKVVQDYKIGEAS